MAYPFQIGDYVRWNLYNNTKFLLGKVDSFYTQELMMKIKIISEGPQQGMTWDVLKEHVILLSNEEAMLLKLEYGI